MNERSSGVPQVSDRRTHDGQTRRALGPMGKLSTRYGSELHLLRYLGRHRHELNQKILAETGGDSIDWHDFPFGPARSKLLDAEHQGLAFLADTPALQAAWAEYWPQGHGIQTWDAVGRLHRAGSTEWLLAEAKAHVAELATECQARPESRARIALALDATKDAFGIPRHHDWLVGYYQYWPDRGRLRQLPPEQPQKPNQGDHGDQPVATACQARTRREPLLSGGFRRGRDTFAR